MDLTAPDIEEYFATTPDPAITLEIIHHFQDWAEKIVSADSSNLESLFQSLATLLMEHLKIPRVTIWDNNIHGESLVLQASAPDRDKRLAHSIPIKGTYTGQAVVKRDITYSKVLNPVFVKEDITQMITVPVLGLTRDETVTLAINLYYRTGKRPSFPTSKEEARRLLSRFSTVLQNQIYKRDNEIEEKVRSIAASAKGISSLFDGISKDIQKITHCSYAILFSFNEADKHKELTTEGFFLADTPASKLLSLRQEKEKYEKYELDGIKRYCLERRIPYVYREELELAGPVTDDNPVTVQCIYVAVPIISSDGKAIGVLACGNPSDEERLAPSFSSFDVHALQRFSGALSPAFERILVTRHEGRLIKTIKSVSDSMLQTQGLNKNLQSAIEAIVETLNSEVGSLYMRRGDTDIFEMRAAKGSNVNLINRATYEVGEGITGTIAEGKILHFKSREELIKHPKYSGKYDEEIWGDRPDQKETFLGVPIWVDGKVKGLWKVSNVAHFPDKYYTDEDMQIAQVLSSFMSYAIQNQEQEERRLKQFTSLAKTSLEIQEAASEEEAIVSVIGSLAEIEITELLFSLYDPQSGQLVGKEVLGSTWKPPASQYKCSIDDENDIRAQVLTSNKEVVTNLPSGLVHSSPWRHTAKQFVLPLRLEDELIGTLQFVETAKLNKRRKLILKAFASHLAISISRLRSINQTFELTNRIMASSRFLVAQTVSTMAVHTVHHKLKDVHKQLNQALEKRQIKENRLLLDTLGDWRNILDGLVAELEDIVTFVAASSEQESMGPADVHPEVQATISTWHNYVRGHKSRVLRPQLQATSSVCAIPAQSFKEILAVLLVNSVQAHAKNIEIKTYNRNDVPVHRNDPLKKDTISAAFCLDCCDDGIGLVAGTTEEIFKSSYTTKPTNFGSGLGLFIARELARNAGGDLEVKDTDQSKGVTFQLTLPVEETQ